MSNPRPVTGTIFLDGKVDEALQEAIGLGDQPILFHQIILQLQGIADETMRFTPPVFPQKAELDRFVEKSMTCFPGYFGACVEDIDLLHHLQRYNACYVAYRTGYFDETRITFSTKAKPSHTASATNGPPKSARKNAAASSDADLPSFGAKYIQAFLDGCHPSMSHLFEAFSRARITGELPLQTLSRWDEERLRRYLASTESGIAQTPLEVEAIIQGLAQQKF